MYENTNQPEKMKERYKALPSEVTELFEYGTVDFVLDNIVKEFALNEEQKKALRMEIELVLYFFLPRAGFVERLQESLEVEADKAGQISANVEENLFVIVDDMLAFAEEQLTEDSKEEVTPETKAAPIKPPVPEPLPPSNKPSFITKAAAPPSKPETPTEPAKKENDPAKLRSLRTFAEDVELSRAHSYGAFRSHQPQDEDDDKEPVHQSNQDDI
ncbi:MAG: hypothetical protein WDZ56_00150, partial [Candidatus Paceibacterota bacterium]